MFKYKTGNNNIRVTAEKRPRDNQLYLVAYIPTKPPKRIVWNQYSFDKTFVKNIRELFDKLPQTI